MIFRTARHILVVATLGVAAAHAQDTSGFEPAVDTSAGIDDIGPAVDTSNTAAPERGFAGSTDEFEPAVDTSGEIDAPADESDGPISSGTPTTSGVMDRITLSRTEITGNQELPKVMYIVPWKKSDPGELMGRPVNTLLDEVLAPIDREEFIREVGFYGDLYGNSEE